MKSMYSEEVLLHIYYKNDGYCWWCGKKLSLKNYGQPDERGSWEVDHSNPVSKGGSHYLRNLVSSCITCNRSEHDRRWR